MIGVLPGHDYLTKVLINLYLGIGARRKTCPWLILSTLFNISLTTNSFFAMTTSRRSPFLPISAIALTLAVFVIDAFTSLDIAIAVLYVITVLLSPAIWPRRIVIVIAAFCIMLTVIAYVVSHGLMFSGAPFARFAVSLVAISVTAFLALKGQAATARLLEREEALHRSQAELAHVTRITILGELASSIAHEVNQPLAAIAANGAATIRWLNRTIPDIGEATNAINNVVSDAKRASEIINRIRSLARKSKPEYTILNINDVVRESAHLVHRELNRNGVQLELALFASPCEVQGDNIQLQQVIINLLVNAMQAMMLSGNSKRIVSLATCVTMDDHIMVKVSDTGPGIAIEDELRLFDAFYTTKRDGMGMGLSICRSIIEAHNGRIWIDKQNPTGVTFCFVLPAYHRRNIDA